MVAVEVRASVSFLGSARAWDGLMTWVTFCSRDMGYTFARGSLVRWAADAAQASVASRSGVGSPSDQGAGEGRREASRMKRSGDRSHSRRILRVKQADQ